MAKKKSDAKKDGGKAIAKLASVFERLGVNNSESWARSQVEEGIPQLGRLLFLRGLWEVVLSAPEESRATAEEIARSLCYLLDGPPESMPHEVGRFDWGLFLQSDEKPTQRLSGLVESFDDVRPTGFVWGADAKNVSLPTATDDNLGQLLEGLSQPEALALGPKVSDAGLRHVPSWPSLKVLSLSTTRITDACAARLLQFPNLMALYVAETAITDKFLETVGSMPALQHLSVADTGVTDAGLEHLSKLTDLQWVLLNGTKGRRIN